MTRGIRRWFAGKGAVERDARWTAERAWARSQGHVFRIVGDAGFVIDGDPSGLPWRLEWGPSQRSYIDGNELRLRCELGTGSDLQALVMNRVLQQALEASVFDQFIEGVQTRIDTETPPETRWLVLFPKLAGADMPLLRDRYIALSSAAPWLQRWLQGPLSQALHVHPIDPRSPFVLMVGRSRLSMRTAAAVADLATLQQAVRLFECAALQAQDASA